MKRRSLFVLIAALALMMALPQGAFAASCNTQQNTANNVLKYLNGDSSTCKIQDLTKVLQTDASSNLSQYITKAKELQSQSCNSDVSSLLNSCDGDVSTLLNSLKQNYNGDVSSLLNSLKQAQSQKTNKNCGTTGDKNCTSGNGNCTTGNSGNTGNTGSKPSVPDNGGSSGSDTSSYVYAKEILALVNAERAKAGVSPLTLNNALCNSATLKSKDMAQNNYFSHTSPTYGSPFQMMKSLGISYSYAGENIAMGQKTPEAVMNAWMNSQGHKDNILSPNFTQLGVGYATSTNGTPYWTQQFIKP